MGSFPFEYLVCHVTFDSDRSIYAGSHKNVPQHKLIMFCGSRCICSIAIRFKNKFNRAYQWEPQFSKRYKTHQLARDVSTIYGILDGKMQSCGFVAAIWHHLDQRQRRCIAIAIVTRGSTGHSQVVKLHGVLRKEKRSSGALSSDGEKHLVDRRSKNSISIRVHNRTRQVKIQLVLDRPRESCYRRSAAELKLKFGRFSELPRSITEG